MTFRSSRRWLAAVAVMLMAAAVVGYFAYRRATPARPGLVTAMVTRGDVVEQVDATGRVQAVTTVQIGHAGLGHDQVVAGRLQRPRAPRPGDRRARAFPVRDAGGAGQRLCCAAEADAERARVQRADSETTLRRARELAARQLQRISTPSPRYE